MVKSCSLIFVVNNQIRHQSAPFVFFFTITTSVTKVAKEALDFHRRPPTPPIKNCKRMQNILTSQFYTFIRGRIIMLMELNLPLFGQSFLNMKSWNSCFCFIGHLQKYLCLSSARFSSFIQASMKNAGHVTRNENTNIFVH